MMILGRSKSILQHFSSNFFHWIFLSSKNYQVHKAFFDRKKSAPIIQGMVQGVVGGGENPFSPHEFFFIFFIFSYQNLKVE